jgi:hypothetical protein
MFHKVIPILIALSANSAFAQNFDMWVVKAGANPSWSIPDDVEYKFPEFSNGYIVTHEGKRTQNLTLNFSHLFVAPVMVKAPGDTLTVSPDIVKQVWIGKTCFALLRDKYYELLTFAEPVKLAKQRYLRIFRTEHIDPTGGIATQRSSQYTRGMPAPGSLNPNSKVTVNAQLSFKFEEDYYFIGPDGKAHSAKESTLLKLYRSKKDEVEAFIANSKTDFNNESDLIKLVEYCQTL